MKRERNKMPAASTGHAVSRVSFASREQELTTCCCRAKPMGENKLLGEWSDFSSRVCFHQRKVTDF